MARQSLSNLWLCGIRMIAKEGLKGHHNARGTEAALQAVAFVQGLLENRKFPRLCDGFNGTQFMAFHLNRKDQTGASSLAIYPHGAGTTDTMLATDMGPGELALIAQGIRKQMTRLNGKVDVASIHGQSDGDRFHAVECLRRSRA
jgi:hypothetical protein